MCPISGLVQFLIVIVTLLLLCHTAVSQKWVISYKPNEPIVTMYETLNIEFNVTGPDIPDQSEYKMIVASEDPNILHAEKEIVLLPKDFNSGSFNITGNFLGKTSVHVKIKEGSASEVQHEENFDVIVIREKRVIDTVFTASVATLVSIIYINFGCALKWGELKATLKKPIGPIIGFIGQFLFMPLISFGVGKVLFPDNPEMQLGMFFTGVSPAGGASNMWTVILGGNINLSVTMTTISTFAAFFMMPLWLFTLGRVLFHEGNLIVPYRQISTYAVALVVPLFLGYLIQRFLKKVGEFFARILKGFSSLLMISIIVFAIITNLYLFKLFSWQIVVAGLGLPWLGYFLAWILAKVCKQSKKDALTIAIEAGIQNTGIAIFLLRFTLPQPEADLTTVVPVAVAIMTPVPLLCLFIYQKITEKFCTPQEKLQKLEIDSTLQTDLEAESISQREKFVSSIS